MRTQHIAIPDHRLGLRPAANFPRLHALVLRWDVVDDSPQLAYRVGRLPGKARAKREALMSVVR